jgi:hypothetical protein
MSGSLPAPIESVTYHYQSATSFFRQDVAGIEIAVEDLGPTGDGAHSDPSTVYGAVGGTYESVTTSAATITPIPEPDPNNPGENLYAERTGDPAYIFMYAETSVDTSPHNPPTWSYTASLGSAALSFNESSQIDNVDDVLTARGNRLIKTHLGQSLTFEHRLSATPELSGFFYATAFTVNADVQRMEWTLNASGQYSLTGFIGAQISPFNQEFSNSYSVDTYDPQSGQDAIFPDTKVRLVWSSTPNPSGNLGTAYEFTLEAPDASPFRDRYSFDISTTSLATAPAGAQYLVMMIDPENTLWESHEEDNYSSISPAEITRVKANFDDEQADSVFGTYLAGVPLETTFTVETLDFLDIGKSVRYTITKPDNTTVKGTAAATSNPDQYQFKYDVGQLPKGTLPLKVELLNSSGTPVGEAWNGSIVVTDQLQVDFKGAANGNSMNRLDKLRFIKEIGVVTDFETSVTTLPLFDGYKDDFDLVLRNSSSKAEVMRKPITFEKQGNFIFARTEDWDTTNQLDNSQEGAEYEAVLSARQKHATIFDREVLNVENLPKWLTGGVANTPSRYDYDTNQFVIHASYPPQLANVDLPTPTGLPFGLFTGYTSQISAGLRVDVFAGLVTTDAVTAKVVGLETSVKLLNEPVVPVTVKNITGVDPISLTNKVKLTSPGPITLKTGELSFLDSPVILFTASIGKSKDFSLTRTILSKLTGFAAGILDLNLDVEGKLTKLSGEGTFTITGIDTTSPQFDGQKSTFTVTAAALGELKTGLGGSVKVSENLSGNPEEFVVAETSITGRVWAKVEGKAAANFSGPVLSPTIEFAESKSRLAAQFGADLKLTVTILNNHLVDEPFSTKSDVYTLFGSDSVKVSLSDPTGYEKAGDGILTAGNVARSASSTSSSLTANAVTASTLTFKDPLDGNSNRVQIDYDITSTINPLAAGRHRFEVVAVPLDTTVAESVLGTVDLATLNLSTSPTGGFQSAAQSLILNLSANQLDPLINRRLMLRFLSDPASGEIVRLRPAAINVTSAKPTLQMTAPNGILNDGAIVYGTETGGQTGVDLQLVNTALPMLLIDDLRVDGTNLRVIPVDELELYGNDLPTPVRVEVINPALAASGTLRFKTNDPARPEVSIPFSYVAPNTAPTIGGLPVNQPANDSATIAPFANLTVNDPNNQNMLAKVTVLNGVVRGDFSAATTTGWTRTVSGNNIVYSRFFNPVANIGSVVQAALRGFVFAPRSNAIKPNTTELTDITVFVNDGLANTTATTRLTTTSVNNVPAFGGTTANVAVNDNATVNPFTALTVTDADTQEMLISVTILNGIVRGDFTSASTAGWAVRYVLGNNITYKRYFSPQVNVGAAAQAAFRALVFQPRQNAINPGTTEATDFQVTVSDGVAPAVLGTGTRVTTTSVNNAPVIGGAVAGQTMNDNQTKAVFSTLTVSDPDMQSMNVIITIPNGVSRGDLTSGSATGWTRTVVGSDLRYNRFFAATANIGATVQSAIRALVFQPRTNVPIGTTETTGFTVFLTDGLANTTNSATSVITTGVAPRPASSVASEGATIAASDITTVVVPSLTKPSGNRLARLLKKPR